MLIACTVCGLRAGSVEQFNATGHRWGAGIVRSCPHRICTCKTPSLNTSGRTCLACRKPVNLDAWQDRENTSAAITRRRTAVGSNVGRPKTTSLHSGPPPTGAAPTANP